MPWILLILVNIDGLMPAWAAKQSGTQPGKPTLEFIQVSTNGRRFLLPGAGSEFTPWGFNYDHDAANRLLETYWIEGVERGRR